MVKVVLESTGATQMWSMGHSASSANSLELLIHGPQPRPIESESPEFENAWCWRGHW